MSPPKDSEVNATVVTHITAISLRLVIVLFVTILPITLGGYAAWRDVKEDLKRIELKVEFSKPNGPWCKLDDKLHMDEFARKNNLRVVPHVRVVVEKKIPQLTP